MRSIKLLFVSIFTLVYINSCGSSSSPSVDEKVVSIVEGVVVDDIIVNAIVTGYSNQFNRLGTTRSDENGDYKLYFQDYRGLVIVEATCDKDSSMKAFNGTVKECPLNTRLRSFAVASGRSTPAVAHITPLTEWVFVRAQALSPHGTITDIAFQQARAEIAESFAVDPFIDNPTQTNYGVILTAINEVAQEEGKTVQEIVDEIAQDISDGTVGDSDTTQDLANELKDNGVTNNVTENNGTYTPITGEDIDSDGDGTITEEESIAYAKDMFKNLRTSTLSLVDYETPNQSGTVDTELRDFGRLVAAFKIKMSTASVYKTDILSAIFKAIEDGKLTSSTTIGEGVGMALTIEKTTPTQWSYKFGSADIYQGVVTLPALEPSEYRDSNNYSQLKFTFDGTLPAYRSKDGMSELGVQTLKGDLYITNEGDRIKITLINGLVESGDDQKINVSKMVVYSDKLINGSYSQLEEIVFDGIISQYHVDARIDVTQYTQNAAISNNSGYLPNEVIFDGMMHNQNSGTKIDATIKAKWQDVALMNQSMVDNYAHKEFIKLDLVVASGDHLLFTQGYDQEPLIDISVNGTIDIEQHDTQIVNMQLQNYSDGKRTLDITYTGEGMFAQAKSTFSSPSGDNGVISVSNNLGITGKFIVLDGTLIAGDDKGDGSIVSKDGTQIGKVDANLVIRYNDGYLESIL